MTSSLCFLFGVNLPFNLLSLFLDVISIPLQLSSFSQSSSGGGDVVVFATVATVVVVCCSSEACDEWHSINTSAYERFSFSSEGRFSSGLSQVHPMHFIQESLVFSF